MSGGISAWQMATASASASCEVGGIVVEREQHLDHALHLALVGAAVAADGLLHACRCVLSALDARGGGGNQRGAAGLPDGERDAGVGSHEGLLERDGVRRVRRYELLDPLEDHAESKLRPLARAGRPAPRRECSDPPVAFVDDPVAASSRSWVDAENLHDGRVERLGGRPAAAL